MVLPEKMRIAKSSENRVRLVFERVAGLAKSLMDECIRTPKAGALPTALHPVIQFFIRLGVFSPKTAVQDGCRFPIRRGIRSFNAAHAAAVVPGCSVMPGAQVPLRFQLQGSSLFALPAAGTACVFRHAHRPVPCKSIPGRFTPE